MEVKAQLNRLRMSPRKVRLVVDVIRGLGVEKAANQLRFINKGANLPLLKLLNSAIANAENNLKLKKDNLYIKKIFVDQGFTLHRWKARAMGRATPIQKRSSKVTIILDEKVPSKKKSASLAGKKEDLKIVKPEEIKRELKKEDKERVEQKEKATTSRLGRFKEKFSLRKGGE